MRKTLSISSIFVLFGSCVLLSQSQLSEQIVSEAHTSASSSVRIWQGTLTSSGYATNNVYARAAKLNAQQIRRAVYIQYYLNQKNQIAPTGIQKGKRRNNSVHASLIQGNEYEVAPPREQTAPRPEKATSGLLPVFDQKDIQEVHKQIANEAYKNIAEKCQEILQTFYVRYDNPKNRGLAGSKSMILSGNVPNQEFRSLFMHEIGHVLHLSDDTHCLGGTADSGASEFKDGKTPIYNNAVGLEFNRISWQSEKVRKVGSTDADFVSGYASWDVFEDFAESHVFFVLHNQQFRELAATNNALAAKYNFFVKHLYPNGIYIATSQYINEAKRPWDITKLLDYIWHPVVVASR